MLENVDDFCNPLPLNNFPSHPDSMWALSFVTNRFCLFLGPPLNVFLYDGHRRVEVRYCNQDTYVTSYNDVEILLSVKHSTRFKVDALIQKLQGYEIHYETQLEGKNKHLSLCETVSSR